ncbi:MAG: biopolymer transporter ExbD [Deltaproteobacteria bacterium]|nr:MAG: biopolymer transporter ExbD [Deltaproteobacteria bacterium]
MRRRVIQEEEEAEINITPMLDIVFIMLIFFIVTASFVKESGVDVQKPGAVTAAKKEHASIFIAITKDGQVWMDRRPVDIRAVGPNVKRMLAENPKGSVIIQADRESKNGILVEVMDQVRLAGVTAISIAAEPLE